MKWPAIVLCLLSLPAPLLAQESSGEDEEGEAVKVAQAKTEETKETGDPDDYKATEEISEDLSVSYPVDI